MAKIVRSTKCSTKYNNTRKMDLLELYLYEYREFVKGVVDKFFEYLTLNFDDGIRLIKTYNKFPNKLIPLDSLHGKLSARSEKAAMTKAWQICKTRQLIKIGSQLYMIEQLKSQGKPYSNIIVDYNYTKPKIPDYLPCSLDTNNSSISFDTNLKNYDIVITLCSLFDTEFKLHLKKQYDFNNKIVLVLKSHKRIKHLNKHGKLMSGILLTEKDITLCFEINKKENKGTEKIGIDTGVKKLFSAYNSNGTSSFANDDQHGWNMIKIMKRLSNRIPGSKYYKKAQDLRNNYINYSINNLLNDTNIKSLHIEHIDNIYRGKITTKFMRRWTHSEIEFSFKNKCEMLGIEFHLENSPYKSQRCSSCGFVHKNNRKGEKFKCLKCHHIDDADINSAKNQIEQLKKFTLLDKINVKGKNKNIGFYWNTSEITL